jgi:hypothetical protein
MYEIITRGKAKIVAIGERINIAIDKETVFRNIVMVFMNISRLSIMADIGSS